MCPDHGLFTHDLTTLCIRSTTIESTTESTTTESTTVESIAKACDMAGSNFSLPFVPGDTVKMLKTHISVNSTATNGMFINLYLGGVEDPCVDTDPLIPFDPAHELPTRYFIVCEQYTNTSDSDSDYSTTSNSNSDTTESDTGDLTTATTRSGKPYRCTAATTTVMAPPRLNAPPTIQQRRHRQRSDDRHAGQRGEGCCVASAGAILVPIPKTNRSSQRQCHMDHGTVPGMRLAPAAAMYYTGRPHSHRDHDAVRPHREPGMDS